MAPKMVAKAAGRSKPKPQVLKRPCAAQKELQPFTLDEHMTMMGVPHSQGLVKSFKQFEIMVKNAPKKHIDLLSPPYSPVRVWMKK